MHRRLLSATWNSVRPFCSVSIIEWVCVGLFHWLAKKKVATGYRWPPNTCILACTSSNIAPITFNLPSMVYCACVKVVEYAKLFCAGLAVTFIKYPESLPPPPCTGVRFSYFLCQNFSPHSRSRPVQNRNANFSREKSVFIHRNRWYYRDFVDSPQYTDVHKQRQHTHTHMMNVHSGETGTLGPKR